MGDAWPTEDTASQIAFCYLFLRGQFAMTEKRILSKHSCRILVETQSFAKKAKVCRKACAACACWHICVNSLFRMHLLVYLKELEQQSALNFDFFDFNFGIGSLVSSYVCISKLLV